MPPIDWTILGVFAPFAMFLTYAIWRLWDAHAKDVDRYVALLKEYNDVSHRHSDLINDLAKTLEIFGDMYRKCDDLARLLRQQEESINERMDRKAIPSRRTAGKGGKGA